MSNQQDIIIDLIVEGRCREAYEELREYWNMPTTWEARKRRIAARNAPSPYPPQTEQEIDARHDRAIRNFSIPDPFVNKSRKPA